jgi:hypothetical protein
MRPPRGSISIRRRRTKRGFRRPVGLLEMLHGLQRDPDELGDLATTAAHLHCRLHPPPPAFAHRRVRPPCAHRRLRPTTPSPTTCAHHLRPPPPSPAAFARPPPVPLPASFARRRPTVTCHLTPHHRRRAVLPPSMSASPAITPPPRSSSAATFFARSVGGADRARAKKRERV